MRKKEKGYLVFSVWCFAISMVLFAFTLILINVGVGVEKEIVIVPCVDFKGNVIDGLVCEDEVMIPEFVKLEKLTATGFILSLIMFMVSLATLVYKK